MSREHAAFDQISLSSLLVSRIIPETSRKQRLAVGMIIRIPIRLELFVRRGSIMNVHQPLDISRVCLDCEIWLIRGVQNRSTDE